MPPFMDATFALVVLALTAVVLRRRHLRLAAAVPRRAEIALEAFQTFRASLEGEYLAYSGRQARMAAVSDTVKEALFPSRFLSYLDSELRQPYQEAAEFVADPDAWIEAYNEAFVERRSKEVREEGFRGPVPEEVSDAQLRAIVGDEDNNLVMAGAGSGKTTTIVVRILYLLRWKLAAPRDIVVLAFNRSVAKEITERLEGLGIMSVEVVNFHKKGYEALGHLRGRKPAVSKLAEDDEARRALLQSHFAAQNDSFFDLFSRWWTDYQVPEEELEGCETPDERIRKERAYEIRTLDRTLVKSQSERRVGDWLSLHGISWRYEDRYPHSPPNAEKKDYTPDFFLPDHGVWLEVWSCDRNGNLPGHYIGQTYLHEMEWKRSLHQEMGTPFIEIFQDDFRGGRLTDALQSQLREAGIEPTALTAEERDELFDSGVFQIAQFVQLIDSFLNLFRAGGWTRDEIRRRAASSRERAFLSLFWSFLDRYEAELRSEEKIDFHEMLIAVSRAESKPTRRYRHVIVDEFQDVSRAQFGLIQALRDGEGRLFAVGDDWQSIYHFAGSDPSILLGLEERVGRTRTTDLEETFRLIPDVAEVSNAFIRKNPHQSRRTLVPMKENRSEPGVCVCAYAASDDGPTSRSDPQAQAISWCLRAIARDAGGEPVSVLLLARYNHVLDSPAVRQAEAETPSNIRLEKSAVHRAKGLQADYAVILGLETGLYGFPTEISDDPVLRMVTGKLDEFANAEERRVFYVAMTRTKRRVFLVAPADHPSSFVQELREEEYEPFTEWVGRESKRLRCPRCLGRTVRRKIGRQGTFWACMNFPQCLGTLPACPSCDDGALEPALSRDRKVSDFGCTACSRRAVTCPQCDKGALIEKSGRWGAFFGCSNWRRDGSGCDFTRNA